MQFIELMRTAFRGQSVSRPGAHCRREPHCAASRSADQARNAGESRIPRPVGQPTKHGMQARTAFRGQSVSRPGAECRREPHSAASRSANRAPNAGENRIPRPVGQPTRRGMQARTAFRGQSVSGQGAECRGKESAKGFSHICKRNIILTMLI
jgi:hypothetical protein